MKNQVLHEAGFDSYLTGWIYYQMVELGKMNSVKVPEKYKGKINLNRSYFFIDVENTFDGVCEHVKDILSLGTSVLHLSCGSEEVCGH